MKMVYKLAYMDMACRFGLTSEAERRKVGALLVNERGVISEGCNGQPSGWPTEVCEDPETRLTLPTVRHAEISCLEKLQNKHEVAQGATMFVSTAPCYNCAIKIKSAGIVAVYYRDLYNNTDGIDYLKQHCVQVTKI
jgi:dCMP deaminase